MKTVEKIKFKAQLVLERSITPVVEELGEHECSMELYTESGEIEKEGTGTIEWVYEKDEVEEVTHIGVWWDSEEHGKPSLTDYDGVFSIPMQAVKLLRKAGIHVDKSFE